MAKVLQAQEPQRSGAAARDNVGAFTEWDPLEEILLGDPLGAMKPADMTVFDAVIPVEHRPVVDQLFPPGAASYPQELIDAARRELSGLRSLLQDEGVEVNLAQPIDFGKPLQTPNWSVANQFCSANPRDSLLLIGDMVIEAPMADRSRYFETFAYRHVLQRLSDRGARWLSAPKPILCEASFEPSLGRDDQGRPTAWATTEHEPLFDAADFMKFGRDIVAMRSHVTNLAGIEWVRRLLGPQFTLHVVDTKNPHAMHIDDTIMPLREGTLLYSPDYIERSMLPHIFKSWELIEAPRAVISGKNRLGRLSGWLNINLLSIDDKRIVVERSQEETIRLLKRLGLQPIACEFESYYPFVGSFHCASLDIRRRGELRNCF